MLRRYAYSYPFVLAAVLAFAFVATNARAAQDVRQPRLTRIASSYVPRTLVVAHAFGCSGPVRACTDMTAGEATAFEDGSKLIQLAPDVAARLRSTRVVEPDYPLSSTGQAVFTLAHELGHLASPAAGQWEEAKADCWAASHWRGLARRLGYSARQLPVLARQIDGGVGAGTCWGPQAGT